MTASNTLNITADTVNVSLNGAPVDRSRVEAVLRENFGPGIAIGFVSSGVNSGSNAPTSYAAASMAAVSVAADQLTAQRVALVNLVKNHFTYDDRWGARTVYGIATDMGADTSAVRVALDTLVAQGTLVAKTKRGSGQKVYSKAPARNRAVSLELVLAFLRDRSQRFTKRSMAALERKFPTATKDSIAAALVQMQRDGVVNKQYNIRKGYLYSATSRY